MKKFVFFISILALPLLILLGCGQSSGNNPTGVTGGDAGGYGSISDNSDIAILLGTWRQDHNDTDFYAYTFNIDGTYKHCRYYYNSRYDKYDVYCEYGTYSVSGNQLTLTLNNSYTSNYTILISGNNLTLSSNYGSTTYYRYY